jgi:hypothetical protein
VTKETTGFVVRGRRIGAGTLLVALVALTIVAALLTPERSSSAGELRSESTGPRGARIAYELAQRMGWSVRRREVPMDSSSAMTGVQVVIGPRDPLGSHEIHHLLENVRRGGGLLFSVDDNDIADSLGISLRLRGELLVGGRFNECPRATPFRRAATSLPPTMHEIVWRRPPPGPVTGLATAFTSNRAGADVVVGFPLGRGRVVAVSSPSIFANDVIRTCEWGADVPVARAYEYLGKLESRTMTFDEFHHGAGVHPGSVRAISMYLSRTGSGRFLATLLVAGLLLLLAAAPRPIVPHEPARIARRSPLEHADALGRAYADVDATRTVTARLVGGLRRRAGRVVPVSAAADDLAFLDGIAQRNPQLAPRVAQLRRGMRDAVEPTELIPIGEAVREIELALLSPPSTRS